MLEGREEGKIIHIIFYFIFLGEGDWVFASEKKKEWGFLLLNYQKVLGTLLLLLFILLDGVSISSSSVQPFWLMCAPNRGDLLQSTGKNSLLYPRLPVPLILISNIPCCLLSCSQPESSRAV